jgi:hypothetical protein
MFVAFSFTVGFFCIFLYTVNIGPYSREVFMKQGHERRDPGENFFFINIIVVVDQGIPDSYVFIICQFIAPVQDFLLEHQAEGFSVSGGGVGGHFRKDMAVYIRSALNYQLKQTLNA